MRLYSDFGGRRAAQITGDIVALGLIALSVWAAVLVHGAVSVFASIGRQLEEAGNGFRGSMSDVGETLSDIPLIGSGIAGPFDSASAAGATLESVGRGQQDVVGWIAMFAALGIAAFPVALTLLLWFVPRLVRAVRAARTTAVIAHPGGLDLLALRALTGGNPNRIIAAEPDALARWRSGDPATIRSLAALEARAVGVRIDRTADRPPAVGAFA